MTLHFLIGTKAELIKMAPVLREFDKRKIPYSFVHTGQHTPSSYEIIKDFKLKSPDIYLTKRTVDLRSIVECLLWMRTCYSQGRRSHVFKKGDMVLVHGDTESTLLGALLARSQGAKVGHVEAGLRSFNLLSPFPEEMIRRIVDRLSSYLFVPGTWAAHNLRRAGIKGKIIDTRFNTGVDALHYALKAKPRMKLPKKPYAILHLHRKETLYLPHQLEKAITCIEEIAQRMPVYFVLAKNTEHTLTKKGLMKRLTSNLNIHFQDYYPYIDFVHFIQNAEFIATDGGTLQEETYILNKPCLILREHTERQEGLGETAYLSELKLAHVQHFLDHYRSFKRKGKLHLVSPAALIADAVQRELNL